MILKTFSVYDKAVGAYLQPFFSPSLGSAIRSFTDAVNDKNHQFAKHSGDYTLFQLADFDDATGVFTSNPEPMRVCGALEMITKE